MLIRLDVMFNRLNWLYINDHCGKIDGKPGCNIPSVTHEIIKERSHDIILGAMNLSTKTKVEN